MYCPTCNKAFPDNHTFCDTCGGKLANELGSAPQPPVQNVSYHQNAGYQQPPSYAPPMNTYANAPANETITTIGWIGYFILFGIPIVGFIALLVLAFGHPKKKSIKGYARAVLILMIIGIIIGVVVALMLPNLIDFLYENYDIDLSELLESLPFQMIFRR